MLRLEPPRHRPQPRPQRRPQQMSPSRRESSSRKRSPPAQRRHLPRPATRQPARCRCPCRRRWCVPRAPETHRFEWEFSADAAARTNARWATLHTAAPVGGARLAIRRASFATSDCLQSPQLRGGLDHAPVSRRCSNISQNGPCTEHTRLSCSSRLSAAPQLRARKVVFIPDLIPQPDWDKYHYFRDKSHI